MKEIVTSFVNCWQMTMVETLVRSAALFIVVGVALLLLRRGSASSRALIWRLTLAAMIALPVLYALLPPLPVNLALPARRSATSVLPSAATMHRESSYLQAPAGRPVDAAAHTPITPLPASRSTNASEQYATGIATPSSEQQNSNSATEDIDWKTVLLLGLFIVWAVGAGLAVLRLLAGISAIRGLESRAMPADKELSSLAGRLAADSGAQPSLRVLVGDPADVGLPPITWGWRRPVIWLPSSMDTWPTDRVRAILLHEVAHISRCDWIIQCLANLVLAWWWFHPGIWLLCRSLRQENERACDDHALACGIEPTDYATHLLETTKMTTVRHSFSAAVSMAQHSLLESRLRCILDTGCPRTPLPRLSVSGLLLCTGLCLILVASLRVSASDAANPRISRVQRHDRATDGASEVNRPIAAPPLSRNTRPATLNAHSFNLNLGSLLPGAELTLVQSPTQPAGRLQKSRSSEKVIAVPHMAAAERVDPLTNNEPDNPKPDSAGISWGEVSSGLQAGIRLTGISARVAIGEHVSIECFIRNTTNSDIAFAIPDVISFYDRDRPTIFSADGKRSARRQETVPFDLSHGKIARITLVLKPGETLALENPGLNIGDIRGRRLGATGQNDLTAFPYLPDPPPGRYLIQQAFRFELSTPEAFETLYAEQTKSGYTRERNVRTQNGETYKTKAVMSDIGELPSRLLSGTAELVVVNKTPSRTAPDGERPPAVPTPVVWGKALSGLAGGLRLKENRRYFDGERLEWEYLVRNVSPQPITFTYEPSPGVADTVPEIFGRDGKKHHAMGWVILHSSEQRNVMLQPGEIAIVGHPVLGINREDTMLTVTLRDPGRYKVSQYFHFRTAANGSQDLMSGPMEFELSGNEENAAWGKTVNGLQAGLSFHGWQARYKIAETIGMDYFIRNAGKQPVRFEYIPQPQLGGVIPVVTDLNDKSIELVALPQGPYTTDSKAITLQPGESIVIGRQQMGLQSGDKLRESITLQSGPGKYKVSQSMHLRLAGQSADSTVLSSGQLEFEVVPK